MKRVYCVGILLAGRRARIAPANANDLGNKKRMGQMLGPMRLNGRDQKEALGYKWKICLFMFLPPSEYLRLLKEA